MSSIHDSTSAHMSALGFDPVNQPSPTAAIPSARGGVRESDWPEAVGAPALDDPAAMAGGGIPSPGIGKLSQATVDIGRLMIKIQEAAYDNQAAGIETLRHQFDEYNDKQLKEMQEYLDNQVQPKSGFFSGLFQVAKDVVKGDFSHAVSDLGNWAKSNVGNLIAIVVAYGTVVVGIALCPLGGAGLALMAAGMATLVTTLGATALSDPFITQHVAGFLCDAFHMNETVSQVVTGLMAMVPAVFGVVVGMGITFATAGTGVGSMVAAVSSAVSAASSIVTGLGALVETGFGAVDTYHNYEAGTAAARLENIKADTAEVTGNQNRLVSLMKTILQSILNIDAEVADVMKNRGKAGESAASL